MRFLIDAQLPPALARHLASAGHEANHVADLGLEAAADRVVWKHAADHGAVIVTKDEDFVALRAARLGGPTGRLDQGRQHDAESLAADRFRGTAGGRRGAGQGEAVVEVRES